MYRKLLLCAAALSLVVSAPASADEIYLPVEPREPVELLPAGTTNLISADLHSEPAEFIDVPDRSFRTLWLRLFPLLNAPLADPFPETQNVNVIDISNSGGLNFYELSTGKLLGTAKNVHFDFTKSAFTLGTKSVALQQLYITPAGTQLTQLSWDKGVTGREVGIRVRGGFALDKTIYTMDADGNTIPNPVPQWTILNIVEVEKYLWSVVPSEILSKSHRTMLEAQAIAARTYSLNQMAQARRNRRNWDMDPTTWYQSYRGAQFLVKGKWQTVESSGTTAATQATAGKAILYSGEVIQAFFSGNSGGITCTVSECFNGIDVPYLTQVPDAPGVKSKAGGTWGTRANLTPQSITDRLKDLNIIPGSPVVKLEPLRKGPSGRTWQLRVKLKNGNVDLDPAQTKKMMHLFGPIRSFLHTLGEMTGGKQSIVGHGFGHGVGMSQEGGEIFANQGWSVEKILTYYYPGTQIKAL